MLCCPVWGRVPALSDGGVDLLFLLCMLVKQPAFAGTRLESMVCSMRCWRSMALLLGSVWLSLFCFTVQIWVMQSGSTLQATLLSMLPASNIHTYGLLSSLELFEVASCKQCARGDAQAHGNVVETIRNNSR